MLARLHGAGEDQDVVRLLHRLDVGVCFGTQVFEGQPRDLAVALAALAIRDPLMPHAPGHEQQALSCSTAQFARTA